MPLRRRSRDAGYLIPRANPWDEQDKSGVGLDDYVDLGEKFKENFGGFYYDPVGAVSLTTHREGEWSCPWCPVTGDHNEREYWSTHFVEDHDVKDTDGIPVVTGGLDGGE